MAIRKSKPKEKKAPEKPTPRCCQCGGYGVLVSARGCGKMVTCPDPTQAINYWNDVIITGGK